MSDERVRNTVSGTVHGPVIQAATVGDVHIHEPAHSPPLPRQLPPPSPLFTDREYELGLLGRLRTDDRVRLVVLTGSGGVGKTALAVSWSHEVADAFRDGQLYVDLRGFGDDEPVHPGDALSMFLRALGVPAHRVPVGVPEQAALYRSITAGRALLVLADNAHSVAQVRVLLPASSSSMVVVTSRSHLTGLVHDGARIIDVPPLSADGSVGLLARVVGGARIAREPQRVSELARICGGLPIALCVAAARMVARPSMSVSRLVAELSDEVTRLDGLAGVDGTTVRAAFDLSYRSLDPAAAALYRCLALHPGNEFGAGVVAAIEAVPGRTVERLLEASLLREGDDERYAYHDLVRLHARQLAGPDDAGAELVMLDWYLAAARRADAVVTPNRRRPAYEPATQPRHLPAFQGRGPALGWLERERVNLVAASRVAAERGLAPLAWQLCDVLWPLFLVGKYYRDRIEVDHRGVLAARAWGNVWAEAVMLKRLGRVSVKFGRFADAETHTRAAIERYDEAGDPRGVLDAKEGLAGIYADMGRLTEAADLLAVVLGGNRRRGEPRSLGLTLIGMGGLATRLGRPEEARRMLTEAREVLGTLADADPYNEVRVTIGLGAAYLATGDLAEAERAATEAAHRMRDLGGAYEQAEAQELLAKIAQRRGDEAAAQRHYGLAVELFAAIDPARAAAVRRVLAAAPDQRPT